MTAFHTMILFSDGAPLTPAGGSSCSLTDTVKAQVILDILEILEHITFNLNRKQDPSLI